MRVRGGWLERDGVGDDLLERAQAKDGAAEVLGGMRGKRDAPKVVSEDGRLGPDRAGADVRVFNLVAREVSPTPQ